MDVVAIVWRDNGAYCATVERIFTEGRAKHRAEVYAKAHSGAGVFLFVETYKRRGDSYA